MGKYSPLKTFLIEQGREFVPMTFGEIEQVLHLKLPASKKYPAWWSNNPSNNPMTKEWLQAGYETESVNVVSEKVVFRRADRRLPAGTERGDPSRKGGAGSSRREARVRASPSAGAPDEYIVAPHDADPLFGCMAGTLTILPDYDYTLPADPDWGKVYED